MLIYKNPNNFNKANTKLPEGVYNVYTWRENDYQGITRKIDKFLDIFRNNEYIEEVSIIEEPYDYSRKKNFIIGHTEFERNIKIKIVGKNENTYDMKIEVPKFNDGYFHINKIKKFALYEMVDLPLVRRITKKANETRIFNNFIFLKIEDTKQGMFIKVGKEKFPILPFFVTYVDDDEVELKGSTLEFKGDYEILNELLSNEIHDIPNIKLKPGYKLTDKKTWMKLLGSNKRTRKLNKIFKNLKLAIEADYFNTELIEGNILIEGLKKQLYVDEPDSPINLENKRIRITEYLILKVLQELFTELCNLPFHKNKNRNMILSNDFSSEEIVSLVQSSADNYNGISSMTELIKGTYLGIGAFSKSYNLSELRDIHPSYYGLIDPIMTPDRDTAGLVFVFTDNIKFNERGEILNKLKQKDF